jgi:hypothetical protein
MLAAMFTALNLIMLSTTGHRRTRTMSRTTAGAHARMQPALLPRLRDQPTNGH